MSPEEITYRGENKGTKVVVSFASAIESKKGWHRFLVFVDINREALTVEALHLSPATEINPYTFRCESPRVPIVGKRSVFLVGATDDDSSVTSSAICATLKSEWKKIVANMSNSNGSIMPTFFAWRRATGVCFLSQISEDTVQFNGESFCSLSYSIVYECICVDVFCIFLRTHYFQLVLLLQSLIKLAF